MNYFKAIKKTYPDIKDSEFKLQDNGKGVFIREWTYSGASKPDLKDLKQLAKEEEDKAIKESKKEIIRAKGLNRIAQKVPIYKLIGIIADAVLTGDKSTLEAIKPELDAAISETQTEEDSV